MATWMRGKQVGLDLPRRLIPNSLRVQVHDLKLCPDFNTNSRRWTVGPLEGGGAQRPDVGQASWRRLVPCFAVTPFDREIRQER